MIATIAFFVGLILGSLMSVMSMALAVSARAADDDYLLVKIEDGKNE